MKKISLVFLFFTMLIVIVWGYITPFEQLNPGNLPPAMYLIKIKTSDGVVVRKVEKK